MAVQRKGEYEKLRLAREAKTARYRIVETDSMRSISIGDEVFNRRTDPPKAAIFLGVERGPEEIWNRKALVVTTWGTHNAAMYGLDIQRIAVHQESS